ncbi:MAG: lysostaphin resistance A-like protein [Woeseiaceae bacterium]
MQEQHPRFPNFWQALLIVTLLLAVEILIATVFHEAGVDFKPGDPSGAVVTVLGCGLIFSILLSYKKLGYRQLFSPSGISIAKAAGPLVLPVILLSFGWMILATEITNLLLYIFPMSKAEHEVFVTLLSSGLASVIALCVVAPLIEEMLFRGLFLRSFLRNHAPGRAILLSALIFGLTHLNVYQFVVASIMGLLLGWLYYVTRSLWPSILTHAINNAGSLLYVQLYPHSLDYFTPGSVPAHSLPLLVAAILAFVLGLRWVMRAAPRVLNDPAR